MTRKKNWISKTIGVVLLTLLLGGCASVFQPSRRQIVKCNQERLKGPVQISASLGIIDGNVALYYDTEILVNDRSAEWNGKATVYYLGNYFTQDCHSIACNEASGKEWRDMWVEAELVSPVVQLEEWLQQIESGEGVYLRQSAVPAELTDSLAAIEEECYCIHLPEATVDWSALADVNPDSMFGGQELISQFSLCNVYLFFDTEDLFLKGVYMNKTTNEGWFEATLEISDTTDLPMEMPEETRTNNGLLSEEWNIQ